MLGIICWRIRTMREGLERFMEAPVEKKESSPSNAEAAARPAGEVEALWLAWRVRALYVLLFVVAVVGLPAYGVPIVNAIQHGQMTPLLWAYAGVYLAFVGLALYPRLSFRLRAWSFVLLAYINAVASFARVGLAGSGRLYLVTMPIIATVLLGGRAGYIIAAVGLATYAAFAGLAHLGLLGTWVTVQANPMDLGFWVEAGIALAAFVVLMVVLLERFYHLQMRTMAAERESQEKFQHQNEYLAALHETALGVMSRLDVTELLEAIVERAVHLVSGAYGFVYLVMPEQDVIEARVGTGLFRRRVGVRLKRGEGMSGTIWQTGQPLAVEAYSAWPGRTAIFDDEAIGPAMGAPLTSGEQVVGILGLTRPSGAAPFRPAELALLIRFAQLASIALENARLHTSLQGELAERVRAEEALQAAYQTLERRVQERTHALAALNAIASVVSRSLDLKVIMSDALDQVIEAIGTEAGAAYRLEEDDGSLILMAQRGLTDDFAGRTGRLSLEAALAMRAIDEDTPFVWQVTADDPEGELQVAMQREGLQLVIGVPLVAKGKPVGALALGTRAARVLTGEEASLLTAVGRQVGVAIENARLYKAERDRHAEAERRRLVAEGMREILAVLNSKQPLGEVLDLIVEQACRGLGCDAVSLFQLQGQDGLLKVQAACGLDDEYVAGVSLPLGVGGAGRALAQHEAVTLPDARTWADHLRHEPGAASNPELALIERMIGHQFLAVLSVPLVVKGEDYGAITLYYRAAREFSDEEVRLALSVANQAALAIESARLREQAERAAAFAERSRLARELHDSVTQSLYSVTLYAEAAARLLTSGQHLAAADHLRELRDTAQEALREMRLLIFELRPLALEKSGLAAALQGRLDSVETRAGIHAELHVEGKERLPHTIQEELYHVAREALNNVLKHAHAQHVRIHLQFQDDATCLQVADDGVGFDPQAPKGGGLGLPGMKERVQKINGELQIESAPGQGTQVSVRVPTRSS
jgi:signal transduction histidine kinase/putative methionine-R-sulfoxide reductase with GAF domain